MDWVDDPDSRVDIVATARQDLAGIARLARGLATARITLARVATWTMRWKPAMNAFATPFADRWPVAETY